LAFSLNFTIIENYYSIISVDFLFISLQVKEDYRLFCPESSDFYLLARRGSVFSHTITLLFGIVKNPSIQVYSTLYF